MAVELDYTRAGLTDKVALAESHLGNSTDRRTVAGYSSVSVDDIKALRFWVGVLGGIPPPQDRMMRDLSLIELRAAFTEF
jgi:hypothetical protein